MQIYLHKYNSTTTTEMGSTYFTNDFIQCVSVSSQNLFQRIKIIQTCHLHQISAATEVNSKSFFTMSIIKSLALKEWQFLQCLLYDNSNTIASDNNMHLALPAVKLVSLHSQMEWPSIS